MIGRTGKNTFLPFILLTAKVFAMGKSRTLESAIVHSNPWYRIRRDIIKGCEKPYFVMEREPFCLIIAEHGDRLLLIEEWRHPSQVHMLDIPGGWLEENEPPITAALREFREETGYVAEDLEYLCAPYAYPGISAAKSFIFRTRGALHQAGQELEATEEGLKPVWMTRAEIAEAQRSGKALSADIYKCLGALELLKY